MIKKYTRYKIDTSKVKICSAYIAAVTYKDMWLYLSNLVKLITSYMTYSIILSFLNK